MFLSQKAFYLKTLRLSTSVKHRQKVKEKPFKEERNKKSKQKKKETKNRVRREKKTERRKKQ